MFEFAELFASSENLRLSKKQSILAVVTMKLPAIRTRDEHVCSKRSHVRESESIESIGSQGHNMALWK